MVSAPEQLHPLWQIAQKRLSKKLQQPAVYRIRPSCFILVNSNGDVITVTIETKRFDIPISRECFALNPDGSCDITATADIVSGLTGHVFVAMMRTMHCSRRELLTKNPLGYNWVGDQLNFLVEKLSDNYLKRVDPNDRTRIIPKRS